jgi:hypothetical protein
MPISKINTTSITDNSVTAGKIVAGAVDADIAAGSIDTAQIADDAVTTAKIPNDAVTTAKIADDAVTSAKLDTNITIAGTLDVDGSEITVGSSGSRFAENNLNFKSGGASYIDHSTVGQNINFRMSNSSSLDTTTMTLQPTQLYVNGNLGVGTSTPDTKVQIKGAINSAQLILGGTDGRGLKISTFNQGGQNDGTAIYDAQDTESSAVNSHHVFKNGGTETLRIRGDGDLFWHDTPSSSAAGIGFTNITHPSISISGGADTNYRHRIVFVNGNGTVGIISTSGSSTAYGTSSDYRLKENVDYTWDATTRLKQLKPARFNFIADPDTTVDGFLAHEAQSVVPESVTGTHNGMKDEDYEVTPAVLDDDGNITTEAVMGTRSVPDIQGIDQSKLVPLLVKTIQELEARITALEDA